jgi:hypothetical protein
MIKNFKLAAIALLFLSFAMPMKAGILNIGGNVVFGIGAGIFCGTLDAMSLPFYVVKKIKKKYVGQIKDFWQVQKITTYVDGKRKIINNDCPLAFRAPSAITYAIVYPIALLATSYFGYQYRSDVVNFACSNFAKLKKL